MAEKSSELRAEGNALYKKGELLKGMIVLSRPIKCQLSSVLTILFVRFGP
jgi:hypothetical protein